MYKTFYVFREDPFALDSDPTLFFLTEHLKKLLDTLLHEIKERKQFILVTGKRGLGKTTLIHEVMARLNSKIRAVPIYHPCKTFDQLLGSVLRELKIPMEKETKSSMLSQLDDYLVQRSAQDETLLIIKRSYEMKAYAFLPKEKLADIVPFLEDVLKYDYATGWKRLLQQLHGFFSDRFVSEWEKKTGLEWKEWSK